MFAETPPEADVHSLDGQVIFRAGLPVSVQVKCSHRPIARKRSYLIEESWRDKWEALVLPGYFVHVSVPPDIQGWVDHRSGPWGTDLATAAFWTRIDPLSPGQKKIVVHTSQRLTIDTFSAWADDLQKAVNMDFEGGQP